MKNKNSDIDLLRDGFLLDDFTKRFSGQDIVTADPDQIKQLFQSRILDTIMNSELFDAGTLAFQEIMFCATYTAELLSATAFQSPPSWHIAEYVIEGGASKNPQIIKQGADVSFLICSIFPERKKKKLLSSRYYDEIGITLYTAYYQMSGEVIGSYMGRHFKKMNGVANQCVRSLQEI